MNLFETVKTCVDNFDPYNLLKLGQSTGIPDNEFLPESMMISERVSKDSSLEEINTVVCEVFVETFGDLPKRVEELSESIYNALKED